jgi:hypothetical protein
LGLRLAWCQRHGVDQGREQGQFVGRGPATFVDHTQEAFDEQIIVLAHQCPICFEITIHDSPILVTA